MKFRARFGLILMHFSLQNTPKQTLGFSKIGLCKGLKMNIDNGKKSMDMKKAARNPKRIPRKRKSMFLLKSTRFVEGSLTSQTITRSRTNY